MALSIDQIPIPVPSSTDPANFSARGDAVFGAFPDFITQTNAVASEAAVNRDSAETSKIAAANSETNAATYAANATTSANNASSSSVAPLWVSGTTYAINDKRVSPITGQVYRRKTAGAGTTDPSLDSTNWYAVLLDADTQYPSIKPTLNLDFANSGKLDPRITFTRASTATYFDKLGVLRTASNNEPRFDYDPVTLEAKGLLIEESRQNLILHSAAFGDASWTKLNCTISSNSIVAPDGTLTGDAMTADGTSNLHTILQGASANASGRTISVYAKAGTATFLQVLTAGSTNPVANFDLVNGTSNMVGSNSTASITPVGNGWYRCVLASSDASATDVYFAIVTSLTSGRTSSNTSSGTLYLWGAQLEAGAFPTSYIPTTSSAVTRLADNAIMTGTNFSSWYRQDEGTIYTEATTSAPNANFPYVYEVSDGTTSNFICSMYAAVDHFDVKTGGTYQCTIDAGTVTQGVQAKVCGTYRVNDFAACIGGAAVVADTSGVIPVVTNIRIGARNDGAFNFNGTIKRISYYPKRLPNYQLQILTK